MAHLRTLGCRASAALIAAAFVAAGVGGPSSAAAQAADAVTEAKVLYANAAYAEALRALTGETGQEVYQYRALSLLALGRAAEAQETLEALVTFMPAYDVGAEDMPPRFIALLAQAKQKQLPAVLRRLLASGREQFQGGGFAGAQKDFELLLTVASDPLVRELADVNDVRLLASAFIDIIASKTPPLAAAPVQPPTSPPPAAVQPQPVITPAVAIMQRVPPWPVRAGAPARTADTVGLVRLSIGADGRVKSASLVRGVHPLYNADLLAAAQLWQYKPAMLNGVPIESETVVSIRVAP